MGEVDTALPKTEPEVIDYYFSGRELDLMFMKNHKVVAKVVKF